MKDTVDCVVCGKRLEPVFDCLHNQPNDGIVFTSQGNYGSTVFDPFDGTAVSVNICDSCFKKAVKKGFVVHHNTSGDEKIMTEKEI